MTMRILVLLFAVFPSVATADITTDLVGHWVCDDNAASTVVVATVGANGTLIGGDNTSDIYVGNGNGPGGSLANAGFTFDGTNDYITIDGAALDITGTLTVAAWIKTTTTTASSVVGGYDAASPFNGYALYVNISANKAAAWGNGAWLSSATSVNSGDWVHLACTRTSGTLTKVYVNGAEDASGSPGVAAALYTGVRAIAARSDGAQKFTGSIADVYIFDRTLTESDIGELVDLASASGPAINPISSSIPGSSLDPIRTTIP